MRDENKNNPKNDLNNNVEQKKSDSTSSRKRNYANFLTKNLLYHQVIFYFFKTI